jgi:PAS domain S-box-containing protein
VSTFATRFAFVKSGRAGFLMRTVHVDPMLTLRLALVFLLFAGVLLAWLGSAFHHIEKEGDQALLKAENERILHLTTLLLSDTTAGVLSDLRYLGGHNELDAYLRKNDAANTRDLGREYAALLRHKRDYDQLRFIDLAGKERVRVDQTPDGVRVTPTARLQDKHKHYYYAALGRLHSGEIYVSPLDLNVENGRIEQPLKPVIRFGIAVFDLRGARRGYVVINFLAQPLLDKLAGLAGTQHPLGLLDARGDWLLSPEAGATWSGQLPERQALGFASRHPAQWQTLRRQASGSFALEDTQYQFRRVFPLLGPANAEARPPLAQPLAANHYYWYLLVANSPAELSASHARRADITLKGGVAAALLALVLSTLLAFAITRQRALALALEQAVDNLPVLVSYIDTAQRQRFNNRAFLETYGLSPQALYGRHVRETLGDVGYEQARPHLERALAGQRQEFELHQSGHQEPRELAAIYVPDLSGTGTVQGVYSLMTDISGRVAAERREREHLLELAQISRLASVGEVTREIAHQINQPLAAIAMFSNAAQRMLENNFDVNQLREWMATINHQAKRASEVVQRLRRFAQGGEIKSGPVDLNAAVCEVLALLEPEAQARQITLETHLAEALPSVLASGILLEQVIYNLVQNAIRIAADRGLPGELTLRTHADADQVWMEVHNPGGGERTVEANAEHPDEVLDLGLSVSRGILNSYQGDLISRSNDDGSTEVRFFLPRMQA